ncbi:MAG: FHA domain-containing protein [Actinobacteria bacterium]|nr:FHA domain-containing protein [Actinomycetota bacterium]
MIVGAVEVEAVLLGLKIAFLVLLYLFIWRIVRTVARDVRLPQESFVLAPQQAAAVGLGSRARTGSLVVLSSPTLAEDTERTLDSAPVTLGRSLDNDMALTEDEFASARHALIEPRRDGVWVEDVGSTNGTFVNGSKLKRGRKLTPGDVIRVGETDLRFEA